MFFDLFLFWVLPSGSSRLVGVCRSYSVYRVSMSVVTVDLLRKYAPQHFHPLTISETHTIAASSRVNTCVHDVACQCDNSIDDSPLYFISEFIQIKGYAVKRFRIVFQIHTVSLNPS